MLNELEKKLNQAKDWLSSELSQFSTGRANPILLDSVKVDSYGVIQPIKSVASVVIEDPKTLRVSPWDKSQIKAIEQAIMDARLPVSLSTDDQGLRVHVPALTDETRQSLVKMLKEKLEQARVRVRGSREEAIKSIDDLMSEDDKNATKANIQKAVDQANADLQELFAKKEVEITTI